MGQYFSQPWNLPSTPSLSLCTYHLDRGLYTHFPCPGCTQIKILLKSTIDASDAYATPPQKKKKDNCTTTDQLWTKKTPWLNNSMAFPHSASSLIGSRAADALPPLLAGAFSGESCLQTMLHIGPDLQRIQQPNNIYIYFYIIIKHDCTCST